MNTSVRQIVEESYARELSGDLAAAVQRANTALETARASGIRSDLAAALACVAFVHFRQGHYGVAQALAEEALRYADPEATARVDAWLVLGLCATETDNLSSGEDYYLQAVDLARQLGYHRALVRGVHNLAAGVYMPRGQFDLALAADREALHIATQRGLVEFAGPTLVTTAWIYWLTGQRDQAHAALHELRRYASAGSLSEGWYFCISGHLAQEEGTAYDSLSLYTRARSIADAIGEPGLLVCVRLGLSCYERRAGHTAVARDWADDALVIANRVGYCHLQGIALIERARATWDGGDLSTAEADLRSAIDILGRLQAAFDLARARLLLAALLYQQQRPEAMAAWLEAMRAMITGGYEFVAEQERTLAFPLIAAYAESPHPDVKAMSTVLLAHLQQIPPPPLHIRGLGRFEVRQQARIIDDRAWSRRRAGELFRLLLLSPQHSLSREQVLESLWPDRDPTTTDDSLHQTTSALRRCLEPDLPSKFPSRYLKVEGGRISLVLPAGSWVDFEAFESLIQDQAWEQALVLYEGDLFPADRYADWAAGPRERLLLKFHQALLVVGRQHLQVGRFQEALEASHRILAVDPWNESAVLLGMRASIAMNQRAEALRLYRELECTLQKDLGIAPQDEVRILYESLL